MYTVGRLARRFGLSRSTLLYYDRIGLLPPSSHAPGEYRHYSEEDAERLRRICLFRDAGLPLADIARILSPLGKDDTSGRGPAAQRGPLAALLEARLEEVHREMMLLRNQQTIIAGLLGLDDMPGAASSMPMTKQLWTTLLADAGFSEEAMRRWHADFEHSAPEQHARFLRLLGIDGQEAAAIRAQARRTYDTERLAAAASEQVR